MDYPCLFEMSDHIAVRVTGREMSELYIFPIEVKAGRSGTLRSLQQFAASGKSSTAVRFDTNPPSRQQVSHQVPFSGEHQQVSFILLSLPLYAVEETNRLLSREQR